MQRVFKILKPGQKNKKMKTPDTKSTKKDKSIKVVKNTNEVSDTSIFSNFPQDVLLLIFFIFKNPYELAKLSTVSKLFLRISSHDILWQQFFDEEAKTAWAAENDFGNPLPAKQFLLQQQRRLLSSFSVFTGTMEHVEARKNHHLNIVYMLDELFVLNKNEKKGRKTKNNPSHNLISMYGPVIHLLNKFYDLAIEQQKSEEFTPMFKMGSPYIRAFDTFQKMLLEKRTESIMFKHPEILEWIYSFAKTLTKERENSLSIIIDVVVHKDVRDSANIVSIIRSALEYLNDPQNYKAINNKCSLGEDVSEDVLKYVLEEAKTEFRLKS